MKEYFGIGSIKKLKKVFDENHIKNVFLVRGKESYESSGVKEKLDPVLKGYNITYFSDFKTNPQFEDIEKGISIFRENIPNIVVSIGGGSVIDMGKLINIFAAQDGRMIDYIKAEKNIENKRKTFVAIPTTSGSGSEATHFAVVYIDKTKYSVANKHILPDYCIVDPQLTMKLPPYITASTGMDALGQAIESYWCVNSTETSKLYAKKAIKLIVKNISKAVNNPSDSSRIAMSKAAHLAGKAINITKTTAPHAVSYPLTSYFGIPHGHAVGLTLGEILAYNYHVSESDIVDKRGIKYVKNTIDKLINILNASDADSAKERINMLMLDIGLKTNLTELGVKSEDITLIVKNANLERMKNNPRIVTEQTLREILKSKL